MIITHLHKEPGEKEIEQRLLLDTVQGLNTSAEYSDPSQVHAQVHVQVAGTWKHTRLQKVCDCSQFESEFKKTNVQYSAIQLQKEKET